MPFEVLKRGSKGDKVKAIQFILDIKADGKFGTDTEQAVKIYQLDNNLVVDGKVGEKTLYKMIDDSPVLKFGSTGKYVYALETMLETMKLDGVYKEDEQQYVKAFQTAKNLTVDGKVGRNTWSELFGLDESQKDGKVGNVVSNNGTGAKQPVYYLQGDSRWGSIIYTQNNTYNKKQTIRNSGCGITCGAMVIATLYDKKITPKETAEDSVKNGYRTKSSGTSWTYFKHIAQKYNATKFIQTSSSATAKACIDAGGLVVVSVKPSIWTTSGHFILWWKIDNDNNVYINDPASKASNRIKINILHYKVLRNSTFVFIDNSYAS